MLKNMKMKIFVIKKCEFEVFLYFSM